MKMGMRKSMSREKAKQVEDGGGKKDIKIKLRK